MKIFGLTAGTGVLLALLAVVAVGSASATVLCEENQVACPANSSYPSGTHLEGAASSFKFEGSLFTEECGKSTIAATTTGEADTPLKASVTSITMTGSCAPCSTVEARNLPTTAKIARTAESGAGSFDVENGGSGKPGIRMTGCPFGATCAFGAAKLPFALETPGASPILRAKSAFLELEEGSAFLCGSSGQFKATYSLTNPTPLFVASEPASTDTVLCKSKEALCAGENTFPSETEFAGEASSVSYEFLGVGSNLCTSSSIGGSTTEVAGNPLGAQISQFSLVGCGGGCQTVNAKGLPVNGNFEATGEGDGRYRTAMAISFEKCAPSGARCVFGSPTVQFEFSGGSSAKLVADEVRLSTQEGNVFYCGSYMTLSGTWSLSSPTGVWLERS